MSVRRALRLAALVIGLAAVRQFLRQPVGGVVREHEDGVGARRIADEDAAATVGPELKLEAVGGGYVVAHSDAPAGALAGPWLVVLTVPGRRVADPTIRGADHA